MATWKVAPPHEVRRLPEDVEADVRVLMAKHASISPRGFDSIREREAYHRRIDELLDEHQMRVELEVLTK